MSVMTHPGGGSSIVLRVGKGRHMVIREMINGWLEGGGGVSPEKGGLGNQPLEILI